MTTVVVNKSTNLLFDHNDTIILTGKLTSLGIGYLSTNNAIYVKGSDDSITMATGEDTIYDQGHGTQLYFNAKSFNEVVYGLQNDPKGFAEIITPSNLTYTMDGHNSIMVTGFGVSVDFKGFHSIAQLESHVRHVV